MHNYYTKPWCNIDVLQLEIEIKCPGYFVYSNDANFSSEICLVVSLTLLITYSIFKYCCVHFY